MRENCTYGSMRGRAYPITRGVPLYSTPLGGSRKRRISAKGSDPAEGFARDSDILSALLPRLVGRRKSPLGSHAVTHQFTFPCFFLASTTPKMLYYPSHMRHLLASLLTTREIHVYPTGAERCLKGKSKKEK